MESRERGAKTVMVATHGHCFDGMASAAMFTRLLRAIEPAAELAFRYRSCGYGPGMQTIPEAWLDGEVNAILDFRYTRSKKLDWYFDHHVTAFASNEERDEAVSTRGEVQRVHYDPSYGSCTKLIADVAKGELGVALDADELVRWADTIDAARFASAEDAIRRDEPILQLASVVEHHGDGPFLNAIVPELVEKPVTEVATSERVQTLWAPLATAHAAFVARVERAAQPRGRVVLVDLTDAPLDAAAKFVTYALFPRCTYSVTLTRSKHHFKLSVGWNPWSGVKRDHDIAAICRRYGGGGHPPVGACSFPLHDGDRARAAAAEVVRELEGEGSA